jgi:formate C-acetyltransferase
MTPPPLSCSSSSQTPQVLGRGTEDERADNLTAVLDGYFAKGGHHINV